MARGHIKIHNVLNNEIQNEFDKCWHKGLIAKLKQAKIEGLGLNLFESYLENRQQCTVVDGMKSKFEYVSAGVPQGSKLGPLLWLIYCNDIVNGIESEIFLFADDTCLFVSGDDPANTAIVLNQDLEIIRESATLHSSVSHSQGLCCKSMTRRSQHRAFISLTNRLTPSTKLT